MMKLLILVLATICLISCKVQKEDGADYVQAKATEQSLAEAQREIGMPAIKNFQQRKMMKLIYELCDREDLICYAYTQNTYTGKLVYVGKCLGYGIPFSAQFTNPSRVVEGDKMVGYDIAGVSNLMSIPQADPNGLFMPTSSSATWLIMIDPETEEPRPVYFEPTVVVSPFKLPNVEG